MQFFYGADCSKNWNIFNAFKRSSYTNAHAFFNIPNVTMNWVLFWSTSLLFRKCDRGPLGPPASLSAPFFASMHKHKGVGGRAGNYSYVDHSPHPYCHHWSHTWKQARSHIPLAAVASSLPVLGAAVPSVRVQCAWGVPGAPSTPSTETIKLPVSTPVTFA